MIPIKIVIRKEHQFRWYHAFFIVFWFEAIFIISLLAIFAFASMEESTLTKTIADYWWYIFGSAWVALGGWVMTKFITITR